MNRQNKTLWILLGGFALLLLVILLVARSRDSDQDRLDDDAALSLPEASTDAAGCAGNRVLAGLKSALFRDAAASRPSDAQAFAQIERAAVARMENAALESDSGELLECSASVAIDLPPGIVAPGGRRNLMANVDYSVSTASGEVSLRNASALISALSGIERSSGGVSQPLGADPLAAPEPAIEPSGPMEPKPVTAPPAARPSFDCANARSRGEQAVCSDPGLAALDRQMASQYGRAVAGSPPDRQALLRQTRDRFLAFRDRCPDQACVAEAYRGRMREISDIVAGRWQPPR
jgi:hypothetical protein